MTDILDLTPEHHAAYKALVTRIVVNLDARLAARKLLRGDRQRAALKGVETKRRKAA